MAAPPNHCHADAGKRASPETARHAHTYDSSQPVPLFPSAPSRNTAPVALAGLLAGGAVTSTVDTSVQRARLSAMYYVHYTMYNVQCGRCRREQRNPSHADRDCCFDPHLTGRCRPLPARPDDCGFDDVRGLGLRQWRVHCQQK
eukprot:scaffold26288_cov111-Isochrysis_galbana.AAC.18